MAITIDGDNGISGVNGTATTPALQGTDSNTGIVFGTDEVQIATGGSTRATVDSSGRLLVGTAASDEDALLTVARTGDGGTTPSTISPATVATFRATGGLSHEAHVSILSGTTGASQLNLGDRDDEDVGRIRYDHSNNFMQFNTAGSERMRIDSSSVRIGKTGSALADAGHVFDTNGTTNHTRSGGAVVSINRTSSDGTLIDFYQDTSVEGNITVSGSTVSYNGAHLSRWSQLASGAARTEILRGSVLSNLDEMCEWAYEAQDAVLYTDEDELPEGVSVGDVKTPAVAAGTEDNEQLNRMTVSDVEGDVNVAGVFQAWDDDDDTYTNDFYCAMTGDFVIRIAQGTTVARGDLLMSAGDGTAKPQDDDIVRSKTIAKVTSTTVSTTYTDGSYCVPCVLMAC